MVSVGFVTSRHATELIAINLYLWKKLIPNYFVVISRRVSFLLPAGYRCPGPYSMLKRLTFVGFYFGIA